MSSEIRIWKQPNRHNLVRLNRGAITASRGEKPGDDDKGFAASAGAVPAVIRQDTPSVSYAGGIGVGAVTCSTAVASGDCRGAAPAATPGDTSVTDTL